MGGSRYTHACSLLTMVYGCQHSPHRRSIPRSQDHVTQQLRWPGLGNSHAKTLRMTLLAALSLRHRGDRALRVRTFENDRGRISPLRVLPTPRCVMLAEKK